MHGNDWEWVEGCYHDSYQGAYNNGAARTQGHCEYVVLSGGAWQNIAADLHASLRNGDVPVLRYINFGFRVAQDL